MKYCKILPLFLFLLSIGFLSIVLINTAKYRGGVPTATNSPGKNSSNLEVSRKEIIAEMTRKNLVGKNFTEWFVSPEGTASGKGTSESPWDISIAFDSELGKQLIKPGDVVWLRGGYYRGTFTSRIGGKVDLPIHYREFPNEIAVIEKTDASREIAALNVRASNVWFWDFEVMNSYQDRNPLDSEKELNPWRGSGINVWKNNTKFINLIVHDNGHGFGLWNDKGGTEIYGCLIFNNGNNKKEHGIYAHNRNGKHIIEDNIIFNNAGYGLHVYANSAKSSISGFDILGNAVFENGAITSADQVADQILVGGVEGVPADRINISENFVYNSPDSPTGKNRGIRLGYENRLNGDVKILNNFIVSRVALKILWWQSVEIRGNTIFSDSRRIEIEKPAGVIDTQYNFDSNAYPQNQKSKTTFEFDQKKLNFSEWQSFGNFERTSRSDLPENKSGTLSLRVNKYEKNRANVFIVNPNRLPEISLNASAFLKIGDAYEVFDAQNYLDKPILEGIYDGKEIILPMRLNKVSPPIGDIQRTPVHTDPFFAAYVLLKGKRAK